MSVHPVSIAIYDELERTGALSELRLLVAKDIFEHPNTTPAESWKRLSAGRPQKYKDSYSPCFPWLHKADVIEETGTRMCTVSGQVCTTWALTGRMPKPFSKPPTRAEREREACVEICRKAYRLCTTEHGKNAVKWVAEQILARWRKR